MIAFLWPLAGQAVAVHIRNNCIEIVAGSWFQAYKLVAWSYTQIANQCHDGNQIQKNSILEL